MSDYTPTTEEVRRAVTSFNEHFDHPRAAEFDGDLFDRWLAEVKAQERDRIIKLLEEGAVLCAGGCGYFVDGGEGDPTCANCY